MRWAGGMIADSSLPGLAFVIAYTASGQDLNTAIWTAIGLGFVMFAIRIVRRETLQFAIAGSSGSRSRRSSRSRRAGRRTFCRGCS